MGWASEDQWRRQDLKVSGYVGSLCGGKESKRTSSSILFPSLNLSTSFSSCLFRSASVFSWALSASRSYTNTKPHTHKVSTCFLSQRTYIKQNG